MVFKGRTEYIRLALTDTCIQGIFKKTIKLFSFSLTNALIDTVVFLFSWSAAMITVKLSENRCQNKTHSVPYSVRKL